VTRRGQLRLVLSASGVWPNTGADRYAVWLSAGPSGKQIRLGFVDPGVGRNGNLSMAGALRRDHPERAPRHLLSAGHDPPDLPTPSSSSVRDAERCHTRDRPQRLRRRSGASAGRSPIDRRARPWRSADFQGRWAAACRPQRGSLTGSGARPEQEAGLVIPAVGDAQQLHPDPVAHGRGAMVVWIHHRPDFGQAIGETATAQAPNRGSALRRA
jgi:hypothetical protein